MIFRDIVDARRSVRAFIPEKQVSDEIVNDLVHAVQAAPSAGNCQPWHFYIIKNKDTIHAIHEKSCNQASYLSAPLVIAVCIDAERCAERYGDRGRSLYCIQDTAAAIENILLCAAAHGLGSCWCGAFDEDGAREVLSIPGHLRPVALIPIGYPANDTPMRPRRPISEILTVID